MTNIDVLTWSKEKAGQISLDPAVFSVEVKKNILHEVVRWQLASRRQGTHMTKTKGLVSGGGKKPFKQKGTGNARQGSSRSPLMPGGGTMFGPQPRDYSYVLPKKVRRLGLSMALSYLLKENKLFVVKDIKVDGKTKSLYKQLNAFGLKKAILVDHKIDSSLLRASRNLESFKSCAVNGVNVYDLLKYDSVILSEAAVLPLVNRCKGEV